MWFCSDRAGFTWSGDTLVGYHRNSRLRLAFREGNLITGWYSDDEADGDQNPGTEYTAELLKVTDDPFEWEVSGKASFVAPFSYAGGD